MPRTSKRDPFPPFGDPAYDLATYTLSLMQAVEIAHRRGHVNLEAVAELAVQAVIESDGAAWSKPIADRLAELGFGG